MLIGEIEGTTSTSQFKFRAYKEIKKFDFVAVKTELSGEEKWILAQVQEVKKHPEGKTEAEGEVIGYREKGLMKRPRGALKSGSMVYKASQELISETFGLIDQGLFLGNLETNPDISIYLDPEDLYRHLAILAKTGSGKSYVAAIVVEELLEKDYPVIILDPHGEYHTLKQENEIPKEFQEKFNIDPESYDVREFSADTEINQRALSLSFSDKNLKPKELKQLIPTSLTNSQLGVLYKVLKNLEEDYDLDKLIDETMNADSKAKWNLVSMLEILQDSKLFSDNPTDLKDLVREGTASVINLKGVEPETQQMVVYMLAKQLFHLRKIGDVPPFIMLIEEAHNFVPERNFGKAVCSDVLRSIASEGRKFGLGIIVVSQRPARIDKNILSQCNTQIIMRVTNPNDLGAISKSFEGVTPGVKSSITALPQGVGFILGKEYPIMTDIRTRKSKHGGETKEVTEEDLEDEKSETGKITSFKPKIRKADLEDRTGENLKIAYYPYWFVHYGEEGIVYDAREGDIKYEKRELGDVEKKVLENIREKPKTKSKLIEKIEEGFTQISSAIESLQEFKRIKKVEKDDKEVFEVGKNYFQMEKYQTGTKGAKLIENTISEEEIRERGAERFGEEPEKVEMIYYPFYSSGEKVYDCMTGEELE